MRYEHTMHATFLRRPNRFVAVTELEGQEETVHVKNTGRCRELLLPGRQVILARSVRLSRKTRSDLIGVQKPGGGWSKIDSQAPNAVVLEWLQTKPVPFQDMTLCRPEYRYGNSRVDFYLECGARRILLEVKGCTLEMDGEGFFPDAPTERGVKHLRELAGACSQGFACYLAFVIAIPGVTQVHPNIAMHPEFGTALQEARNAGVRVLYLPCEVGEDRLEILGQQIGGDV